MYQASLHDPLNQDLGPEEGMANHRITDFYDDYYGHDLSKVHEVLDYIRSQGKKTIFLAGDSSLDNKHWFTDKAKAVNGYEKILEPKMSKCDVSYHLNRFLSDRKDKDYVALNCAVEEASIGQKGCMKLNDHDIFIRDNIREDDILVVSIGGNDIALSPSVCTGLNTLCLTKCIPNFCLKMGCGTPIPCDDYCAGCCTSTMSNLTSFPPSFGYFLHLFGPRVQDYLRRLTSGPHPPRQVLICCIYYVDEKPSGSWADTILGLVGYNKDPVQLQMLTRLVFKHATSRISLPRSKVVPVPLFTVMDGKDSDDYCERVEPSSQGGRKMASLILKGIEGGREAMLEDFHAHERQAMNRL
jgi:hypothetical protein